MEKGAGVSALFCLFGVVIRIKNLGEEEVEDEEDAHRSSCGRVPSAPATHYIVRLTSATHAELIGPSKDLSTCEESSKRHRLAEAKSRKMDRSSAQEAVRRDSKEESNPPGCVLQANGRGLNKSRRHFCERDRLRTRV